MRELFQLARSKKACILFIDEVDAIGGARGSDEANGDSEVQRTMLEIVRAFRLCIDLFLIERRRAFLHLDCVKRQFS